MEFKETQPIYLQIADFVCEKIISKTWTAGQRIPAVRELAVLLEVNPNTVMRTYEFLQQKDIIYNQRGVGLFVATGGYKNALEYRRAEFLRKEMPSFFRSMQLLQMDIDDIAPLFRKYKKVNA